MERIVALNHILPKLQLHEIIYVWRPFTKRALKLKNHRRTTLLANRMTQNKSQRLNGLLSGCWKTLVFILNPVPRKQF